MTCVESQFLATVDPVKVAAAGAMGRVFGRGMGQMLGGGMRQFGRGLMGPGIGKAVAKVQPKPAMGPAAPAMGRNTPVTKPMQRMMGNPDFQEVLGASQSGFPKLPGMNIMSPSTQQGILRPGVMGSLGSAGGTGNTMQRNLAMARPAMARAIGGFRAMQRQGLM